VDRLDPALAAVRLLLRPDESTADPQQRISAAVGDVASPLDDAGRPWRVRRLAPRSTGRLRQCWAVSGLLAATPSYDSSRVAYDLAAGLSEHLGVEVEPDLPSSAFGREPTDDPETLPESLPKTWAVDSVRAREAWDLPPRSDGRTRGEGVLIGHIDTGWTRHPELDGALDLDRDFDVIDDDNDAHDPLHRPWFGPLYSPGHGTRTGSVIASRETGAILGSAPRAVLVPGRAVKSVVQVLDGDVARAVDLARRRGCHIISMSLGGRGFFGLRDAIADAVEDGVLVMAAAGNKVRVVTAPAVYPECLAVAGSNAASRPWSGSSRGPLVDVSAPGESVWVASVSRQVPPVFGETQSDGTSYAVATLAGVAALWLAHHGHAQIIETCGRRNVQRAFLSLIEGPGHRVPDGWPTEEFGVGIVDAVGLLAGELPDAAQLDGGARQPFDAVARLQGPLSGLTREETTAAVATLLDRPPVEVGELPTYAVSELAYRLGEDDDLRHAVLRVAPGVPPDSREQATANARFLLSRTASRALSRRP
jgi:hypothetical protein